MTDSENPRLPTPTSESKKYIVNKLLLRRRVHLITGSSGVGKTRWLLPWIADWIRGKDVFDYQSFPLPCGYLVCDRCAEDALDTIKDLHLDHILTPDVFPVRSWMDESDAEINIKVLPNIFPKAKVLFIESIAALVPQDKTNKGVNDYISVMRFFKNLNRLIQPHDLTILATNHPPKTKQGDAYTKARDQIRGSNAWAEASNTIFNLEEEDPEADDSPRRLLILPRNAPKSESTLAFNSEGQLVPAAHGVDEFILDQEFNSLPPDEILFTQTVLEWAEKGRIKRRTAEYWLSKKLDQGSIERIRKGAYRVRGTN